MRLLASTVNPIAVKPHTAIKFRSNEQTASVEPTLNTLADHVQKLQGTVIQDLTPKATYLDVLQEIQRKNKAQFWHPLNLAKIAFSPVGMILHLGEQLTVSEIFPSRYAPIEYLPRVFTVAQSDIFPYPGYDALPDEERSDKFLKNWHAMEQPLKFLSENGYINRVVMRYDPGYGDDIGYSLTGLGKKVLEASQKLQA